MRMGLPVFLASTSPRRHQLLNQVNVAHQLVAVAIDETQLPDESPIDYIERMVSQKATAALSRLDSAQPQALVITADTIGVLSSGAVLQKPHDYSAARAMWQQMSASEHQVWTAVQVSLVAKQPKGWVVVDCQRQTVKTLVAFVALTETMMARYWATGEPHDKAGGYAIQGQGAAWVKAIHGSYSNVVGLPLVETLELLDHYQSTM